MKPIHLLRYGLPGAILVAGIVLIGIGGSVPEAAGVTAVGIAVMVVGVNLFARMTVASARDRDREERARENYARTGRWEDPPAEPAEPAEPAMPRVAGPAGLPLARPVPPPPPVRDLHDPGHRSGPPAGGGAGHRRSPERPRRQRRPD